MTRIREEDCKAVVPQMSDRFWYCEMQNSFTNVFFYGPQCSTRGNSKQLVTQCLSINKVVTSVLFRDVSDSVVSLHLN